MPRATKSPLHGHSPDCKARYQHSGLVRVPSTAGTHFRQLGLNTRPYAQAIYYDVGAHCARDRERGS